MTLKQIEYFLSCGTLLNFRKAAQLHYVSPSTLTRHIAALEEELGTPLLTRDSHKVEITQEGSLFFDTAHEMMLAYQKFYEEANLSGFHLERQGNPFLIGSYAFDGMYAKLVDYILDMPDFFLKRPIHIDIIEAGKMISSVYNKDIQIGIDSEMYVRKSSDIFETKLLSTVPFNIAVESDHPWCSRKSISVDELIAHIDSNDLVPIIYQFLQTGPLPPINSAEALRIIGELSIEVIPDFVKYLTTHRMPTNSFAVLPATFTGGNTHRLRRVAVREPLCSTNYVLFWRKDSYNDDIAKFLEIVH